MAIMVQVNYYTLRKSRLLFKKLLFRVCSNLSDKQQKNKACKYLSVSIHNHVVFLHNLYIAEIEFIDKLRKLPENLYIVVQDPSNK